MKQNIEKQKRITSLREQMEYQREIGCNNTADLLAVDLYKLLAEGAE
jgi:hypothetical protein